MRKFYLLLFALFFVISAFGTEPAIPASNLSTSNVQGNSVTVNFTKGNGTSRIAVLKSGSPVTAIPQNGNSYLTSSTFGNGQELAPGEYVVYNSGSTAGSFQINNLIPETEYHIAVFEYNGSGVTSEYLTGSYLSGSFFTLFAPTVQPFSFAATHITGNNMDISWSRGDGNACIVLCKEGEPVNANPVELVSYYANNRMGYFGVNQAATIGDGNRVLYKGAGTGFTVTEMNPSTTYHFAIFEYNGSTGPVYLVTNPLRGFAMTLPEPTVSAANLVAKNIEGDRMGLQWTNGNGTRRIVVAREGTPVDAFPQNNVDYNSSPYFDIAPEIAPGHKVVYDGTAGNCNVYNLLHSHTYYFAVFEYSGSGSKVGYRTIEYPETGVNTLSVPLVNVSDIDTTNLTAYGASLSFIPGNGNGRIIVMKKDEPVDFVPNNYQKYNWNTTFGSTYGNVGNGNYLVYNGTGSNVNVSLQPNTKYYVAAFEYNGVNNPVYATSGVDTLSFKTKLPPAPTIPSKSIAYSSVEGNSMRVYWTKGDGERRVLIARKGNPVDSLPQNGIQYTANQAFNLAPEIAPGQKVIYDGTGNSTYVDSLETGSSYYFMVVEYNGTGEIASYLTNDVLTGTKSTLHAPTVSSSQIHFELLSLDKLRIFWKVGNGSRRLILGRKNAPVDGVPENLKTYYASIYFGGGSKIGASGESCVVFNYTYSGKYGDQNLDTVYTDIMSMEPGNTYYFSIFEYNGVNGPVYKQADPAVASFMVTFEPPSPATGFKINGTEGNLLHLYWTVGGGDKRVIIAREGQPVDVVPLDGTEYTANKDFRKAPEVAPGQKVIYNGSGYFTDAEGLNPDTPYFFKIFEYGGAGTDVDYLTEPCDSTTGRTYAAPTLQASSLSFSAITPETGTVSWTNGNGQRRIAVAKKGSPVNVDPKDTTSYTWNQYFGRGSHLGDGNYVVYKEVANNFTLMQLLSGTTYHVSVYEFNGNTGPMILRPGLAGKFTTLGPPRENAQILEVSLLTKNSFQINLIPGSGQKRIIVMREGSPVDANPADHVNYLDNSYLGAGDELTDGNFVVYNGEDDNIIVTGLKANTTYHFSVFEYNAFNGGTIVNYLVPTSANGMATTNPDNTPPVLQAIDDKSVNEMEELAFTAAAFDDDYPSQVLTFSLDALSQLQGMNIDPYTGHFSWTPDESQGDRVFPIEIIVTDNGNNPGQLRDTVSFSITVTEVNSSPEMAPVDNQNIDFEETLNLTFSAQDADIPEQTLSFSIDPASAGAGMSVNPVTGEFNWTPAETQKGMTFNVLAMVTDNGSNPLALSDTVSFTISVTEDTISPVISPVSDVIADNDAGDCGAAVVVEAPVVMDNRDVITATGTRSDGAALNSTYPVGETYIFWTAEDNAGNKSDTVTQKITVIDVENPVVITRNLTLILNDDQQATLPVDSVNNHSFDNCEIQSFSLSQTQFDCNNLGENLVTLTATDFYGNSSGANAIINVQIKSPLVTSVSPSVVSPGDYLTISGSHFSNINSVVTMDNVNAEIVSQSPEQIVAIVPAGFCNGAVKVNICGHVSNGISVSGTDSDYDGVCDLDDQCPGSDDTQDFNGNGIPDGCETEICDGLDNDGDGQIDENLGQTWYADLDEDGFGDPSSVLVSCSQPDGYVENAEDNCPNHFNPDQQDADRDGFGDTCDDTPFVVDCVLGEWSPWSECDAVCGGGLQYRTREVLHYPSNGGVLCGDTVEYRACNIQPCGEGCPDSISVVLLTTPLEPNPINTPIAAEAEIAGSLATVQWNWGDGYTTLMEPITGTISATHTYQEAGVYRIELIATDTCGNSDTIRSTYIPIYDPDGGFVSGGGWIWSPPGAYKNDLTLEGKASFGFVAKYKKGSDTPQGHTEFHFRAGNLNFNSTSYDALRLIISGAKAQFKGVGTINNQGKFGFLLSVIDGNQSGSSDLDKFRIKIWDIENNGETVYDNNMEMTDENADPSTAIREGSIIIHKPKGNKSAQIADYEHNIDSAVKVKVWPNPFSEKLLFEFSSPVNTHAVLDLYDINGRKIKTLFDDGIRSQETMFVEYHPENVITQILIYRLRIGENMFTERIIYKR